MAVAVIPKPGPKTHSPSHSLPPSEPVQPPLLRRPPQTQLNGPDMNAPTLRQTLLAALIAGASLMAALPTPALAYDVNSMAAFNVDAKGVAVQGYDVVAYQTQGAPTPGNASFMARHEGATYLFGSAANRELFVANPAKYAPQFGGFCAMGVALEKKLDGDPMAWRVVDGKLYLNVNQDVQKKWLEDVPGNIKNAGATWPRIKAKAPKDL